VRPGASETPLEQLSHHAECEVRLKFGPASAQHFVVKLSRPSAGRLNERRLADADATFDRQSPAPAIQ
jgi:hypothetical protein